MKTRDPRYPQNWSSISFSAKQKYPTCCFCLVQPSKETHHSEYIDSKGELLLDRVKMGETIFTVCNKCHDLLHTKAYWDSFTDTKQNRQKGFAKKSLQIGFNVLYSMSIK